MTPSFVSLALAAGLALGPVEAVETRPGFERVVIKPYIPVSLTSVKASVQTVRGRVAVDWKKQSGSLQLNVTIPANSTATIYVPATSAKQVQSTPALKSARFESGAVVYEIGSGDYEFRAATDR